MRNSASYLRRLKKLQLNFSRDSFTLSKEKEIGREKWRERERWGKKEIEREGEKTTDRIGRQDGKRREWTEKMKERRNNSNFFHENSNAIVIESRNNSQWITWVAHRWFVSMYYEFASCWTDNGKNILNISIRLKKVLINEKFSLMLKCFMQFETLHYVQIREPFNNGMIFIFRLQHHINEWTSHAICSWEYASLQTHVRIWEAS